jgi:taurine dioxygenase
MSTLNQLPDDIAVRPLSGSIGATVSGLNVKELNKEQFAVLREAFLENCMLVFPQQQLSVSSLEAFSAWWGMPVLSPFLEYFDGHPGVSKLFNRGKSTTVTENWHSDSPFLDAPPSINFLSAVNMPVGGDTMWCNQYLAYETLSSGMQEMLSGLKVEFNGNSLAGLAGSNKEQCSYHPIVRTHPETGRKSLFVGSPHGTARRFEHLTEAESFPLLQWLYQHSSQPDRVYRHHWNNGDLVMWDNRCTLHYAVHDYGENTARELYRICTKAEQPA